MGGASIYHFQYEVREGEWRAIGAGEGDGADAPRRALEDLRGLAGGSLVPGRYRYLLAFGSTDERWGYLVLSADGTIGPA